jgi:Secretory lipase
VATRDGDRLPGLGTPEIHPYLVGVSEARAVIDSVRAARATPGASAGPSFAVWGHSQGGQAALFTGILADSYAPELHLVGVAAAAPATNLRQLMMKDIDTSGGRNITAMTLWSWSRIYNIPMDSVVTPQAIPAINQLAGDCIERFFDLFARRGPTQALSRSFLRVNDFASEEPWRSLLQENSPGALPRRLPVFLAQARPTTLSFRRLPPTTETSFAARTAPWNCGCCPASLISSPLATARRRRSPGSQTASQARRRQATVNSSLPSSRRYILFAAR